MQVYKVTQNLVANPLADVAGEVIRQLDRLPEPVPFGEIAITVGSRGIANLPILIKTCGQWLSERGGKPFIVPAMGSHNGATALGQRHMLESLGITESAMQMPIRSSMDVVELGRTSTGPVFMDRNSFEAAGVLVVNRIKLHTCFSGPIQSGLTKMMVVGLGKTESAKTFHSAPTFKKGETLLEMGRIVFNSGQIFAGLGILEDGYDQTAELHAISGHGILDQEPDLLKRHRHYFPRLPIDRLNVLVVDTMGKTISGTGMDTNVVGQRGAAQESGIKEAPEIDVIAALTLSKASQGNAIGVGLADFITRRLRDAIDEEKTMINAKATGEMSRVKIPETLPDDEHLIQTIAERHGDQGWMLIPNTLNLETLYVTEDVAEQLQNHPICQVSSRSRVLPFLRGRLQVFNG